eukprot:551821-Alexandrium_andersonii.AAC.1
MPRQSRVPRQSRMPRQSRQRCSEAAVAPALLQAPQLRQSCSETCRRRSSAAGLREAEQQPAQQPKQSCRRSCSRHLPAAGL